MTLKQFTQSVAIGLLVAIGMSAAMGIIVALEYYMPTPLGVEG